MTDARTNFTSKRQYDGMKITYFVRDLGMRRMTEF